MPSRPPFGKTHHYVLLPRLLWLLRLLWLQLLDRFGNFAEQNCLLPHVEQLALRLPKRQKQKQHCTTALLCFERERKKNKINELRFRPAPLCRRQRALGCPDPLRRMRCLNRRFRRKQKEPRTAAGAFQALQHQNNHTQLIQHQSCVFQ